jgi:CTP:molybdopterin cytidylyltransferase MocA
MTRHWAAILPCSAIISREIIFAQRGVTTEGSGVDPDTQGLVLTRITSPFVSALISILAAVRIVRDVPGQVVAVDASVPGAALDVDTPQSLAEARRPLED